jgi:hypothetical protein
MLRIRDFFINFITEPIGSFGRNLIFISIEIPILVDFVGGIFLHDASFYSSYPCKQQ